MSTRGCINGTLVATDTYSSPVPIIGLYVAAASLVCMLMMLFDIVNGFRAYKRWLPCKLFTLNSVTLTLLSIATKLPVDLTTQMPSVQDQLSKLSGTVLICIAMGFFVPSVGIASKSESFANMAALSIFVVTIIVNISIQISTGVIVLFVPEHIITLSCMYFLLIMLWCSSLDVGYHKIVSADHIKSHWEGSPEPMLKRLKDCQYLTYSTNPQFVASKLPIMNVYIVALCLVSLVVQIQAAVRSLILKKVEFCGGNSEYDWSVFPIVVAQTLTVMVGGFAVIFRCLAMSFYNDSKLEVADLRDDPVVKSPILRAVSILARYRKLNLMIIDLLLLALPNFPKLVQRTCVSVKKFEKLDQWTARKAADDRKRLRDAGRRDFPNHMFQLLLSTTSSSSQLQFNGTKLEYQGLDVSSLTIVLVVRVAQVVLPDKLSRSLVQAFVEVKELIHFIDKTIHPKNIRRRNMFLLAEAVWDGNDFSCLIPVKVRDDFIKLEDEDRKLLVFADALPSDPVLIELEIILNFIKDAKSSSTGKDLHTVLKETFVGMLRVILANLPCAINTSLIESPAEDFEKRVRFALQQLFRMRRFHGQIQWSFPDNCPTLIGEDSEAESDDLNQVTESDDVIVSVE